MVPINNFYLTSVADDLEKNLRVCNHSKSPEELEKNLPSEKLLKKITALINELLQCHASLRGSKLQK